MSDWGGKPAFGLLPLSAHKQNKEIPSMAVLALFIETIDGIAYFAIAVRGFFQNLHKKLEKVFFCQRNLNGGLNLPTKKGCRKSVLQHPSHFIY